MASERDVPFGARLRSAREAAGLTQEALAERAGLSFNAVSALERGTRRHPYPTTIRALATALALSEPEHAALAAAVPPRRAGTVLEQSPAPTYPVPLTSLIGRADEVAAVTALFGQPEVRFLTLTGPGGVGKTRLALAVAVAMAEHFPDGVHYVDLAAIGRPEQVLPAIAETLGLRERIGEERRRQLWAFLRLRRLLLILDNFEQVLGAAPELGRLLTEAPGFAVLVTSRAPLRIAGEREVPVAPLPLPDAEAGPDRVLAADAGRLFVERVRAHDPTFVLDAEAAPLVAEICARLDGLPLAIELAAARGNVLSLGQLRDRLNHRLPLLTQGARDAPPRHRTMRDAIAWSYELLAADEQWLFRQLAVFAGGCTIAAAEWMVNEAQRRSDDRDAGGPASARRSAGVLDVVGTLVEQSLLARTIGADGVQRFRMLETIRELAVEQLSRVGELERARSAQAEYLASLAWSLYPQLITRSMQAPLNCLGAEQANIHAALEWLDATGPDDAFVHLVAGLSTYWQAFSYHHEGRRWVGRALEKSGRCPDVDRGRVLLQAAFLVMRQGEQDQAARYCAEGIPLLRTAAADLDLGMALISFGAIMNQSGHHAEAEHLLTEALTLAEARQAGPVWNAVAGNALANLTVTARERGDLALAAAHSEAALRLYDDHALALAATRTLMDLGDVAHDRGNLELAVAHYLQCIEQTGDRGDMRLVADALASIGGAARVWGQARVAVLLMAVADALRERVGTAILLPRDRAASARNCDALRGALGEETFAAAWAEGRRLALGQAVAIARSVMPPATPVRSSTGAPDHGLTRRQAEVLRQMASWQTDREIADALCMSPRTVSWHVRTILGKLGAKSRRDAVARARAAGLL